jgi:hypothetical protein
MKPLATTSRLASLVRTTAKKLEAFLGALFAGVFAVMLLLYPANSDSLFAWTVKPPIMATWIGAAYLFRTFLRGRMFLEADQSRIQAFEWGNFLFSSTLLLATAVHRDRFNWGLVTAWIWLILYALDPFVILFFQWQRRGGAEAATTQRDSSLPSSLRTIFMVEAVLCGLVGILLLLAFDAVRAAWPWQPITPLNSRAMSAWWLGWMGWAGAIALARDWRNIRLLMQSQIVFGLALIAHFILSLRDLDLGRSTAWLYLGLLIAMTVLAIYFYWRGDRVAKGLRQVVSSGP